MYIKAKQGYNIVINDIEVSFQNGKDYIYVDDEKFNNSNDAKRVMQFLDIKDKVDDTNVKKTKKHYGVQKVAPETFVAFSSQTKKQTGAHVFDPNNESDNREVIKEKVLLSEQKPKTANNKKEEKVEETNTEEVNTEEANISENKKANVNEETNTEETNVNEVEEKPVEEVEETKDPIEDKESVENNETVEEVKDPIETNESEEVVENNEEDNIETVTASEDIEAEKKTKSVGRPRKTSSVKRRGRKTKKK